RMVRGFYIALDQEVHAFAGKFWRTTEGAYVPFDHVLVHQSSTEFEGVWVGHEDEPRKLPIAFSLRRSARQYRFDEEKPDKPPARVGDFARFSIIGLTDKRKVAETRAYFETTEGWWMRDLDGTPIRPLTTPPPSGLAPGEKWIDVNITNQTLIA